ncbi:hypothetical protein BC833DRAFT_609964 [Globomyces pollinis-pini]|nr:hypothetical protein BC833DRAFT_609964 [Globomyces pollinis-pini]
MISRNIDNSAHSLFLQAEECYARKQYTVALKWYLAAAEQSHTNAHCRLNYHYLPAKSTGRVGVAKQIATPNYVPLPLSEWSLAFCYLRGVGAALKPLEARALYEKNRANGSKMAELYLALMDCEELGNAEIQKRGFNTLLKLADEGLAIAQIEVSDCFEDGIGCEKNLELAFKYSSMAAEQGDFGAIHNIGMDLEKNLFLGTFYEFGTVVKKDYKKAFDIYYKSVYENGLTGIPETNLAQCYLDGKGTEKNIEKAVELLKRTLHYSDSYGMYLLAKVYVHGQDPILISQGVKLAERAAALENVDAVVLLGDCYRLGLSVKANAKMAFTKYESVEKESSLAMVRVGDCFMHRFGVSKKSYTTKANRQKQAFEYYQRAVKLDELPLAYTRIGECYEKGAGIDLSLKDAKENYLIAAENECPEGSFFLGKLYLDELDINNAIKYFELAIKGGVGKAKEYLKQALSLSLNDPEKEPQLMTETQSQHSTDDVQLSASSSSVATVVAENIPQQISKRKMDEPILHNQRKSPKLQHIVNSETQLAMVQSMIANASKEAASGMAKRLHTTVEIINSDKVEQDITPPTPVVSQPEIIDNVSLPVVPQPKPIQNVSLPSIISNEINKDQVWESSTLSYPRTSANESPRRPSLPSYIAASGPTSPKLRTTTTLPHRVSDVGVYPKYTPILCKTPIKPNVTVQPQSNSKMFSIYRISAEQGDSTAQFLLGQCYFTGDGVPEDRVKAVAYFLRAAGNGDPDGQYSAAMCHLKGDIIARDPKRAFDLFLKASENSNFLDVNRYLDTMYRLGIYYREGIYVAADERKATDYFDAAARGGHIPALVVIAKQFEESNKSKSFIHYKKAADLGDLESMYKCAIVYRRGSFCPNDMEQCMTYLKRAVEYPPAKYELAKIYMYEAKYRDYETAFKYFNELDTIPRAAFHLGYIYDVGLGRPIDITEARRWYSQASQRGVEMATFAIARLEMLENGARNIDLANQLMCKLE